MAKPSEIFARVQRLFGDMASVQVIQQDIIDWMNEAQLEVVTKHPGLLPAQELVSPVANQADYPLPQDCFAIDSVYYAFDGVTFSQLRSLSPLEFTELYSQPFSDIPLFYTKSATIGKFTLYPIPSVSGTNLIRVNYYRYAEKITDANEPSDLPQYYDNLLFDWCMLRAYELDENWDAANRKEAKIAATIMNAGNNESWFEQERYPHTSATYGDV